MQRRNVYLHSDGSWSPDPTDAVLRLESVVETQTVGQGSNLLYRPGASGWEPLVDEGQLSPAQRGLLFEIWPQQVDGRDFVALRSLRVVDRPLLEGPLAGLTLYDRQGRRLPEPAAAGRSFLLSPDDARAFAERIKPLGVELRRVDDQTPEIRAGFEQLRICREQMQGLLNADLPALEAAAGGDLTVQSDFDARGKLMREQLEAGRSAREQIDAELTEMARAGSAARARSLKLGERLASLRAEIEGLAAVRRRGEEMMARYVRDVSEGRSASSRSVTRHSEVAVQLLLRDLAELLRSQGVDVQLEADRLKARTEYGEFEIGRELRIHPSAKAEPAGTGWMADGEWL